MTICKIGKSRGCEFELYYEIHSGGDSNEEEITTDRTEATIANNNKEKCLLIMGFLTPCQAWARNLETFKLDPNYEYVIYDNRGVGKSGSPTTSYSSKSMAMDAIELIDHLGWKEVHVVGVSMGGMISLELAHLAPKRIKSLALVVTHAGSLAPLRGILGITQSLFIRDHYKRGMVLAEILYSKDYLSKASISTPTKTNLDLFLEKYVEDMTKAKPPSLSALYGHIRVVNTHNISKQRLLEIKENLKGKITIITGTHDDLVDAKNSHYLNSMLDPVEFVIFNGSGHSVNIENYTEFHDAISRHFKRTTTSQQ